MDETKTKKPYRLNIKSDIVGNLNFEGSKKHLLELLKGSKLYDKLIENQQKKKENKLMKKYDIDKSEIVEQKFIPESTSIQKYKYYTIKKYKYTNLTDLINTIRYNHNETKFSYKILITLHLQLIHIDTGEKRNFYHKIIDKPTTITNNITLNNLIQIIENKDDEKIFLYNRPTTKWKANKKLEFELKYIYLNMTIGCLNELPDYIKQHRHIIGLTKYKDNLCFWRCLAINNFKLKVDKATKKAKELYEEYYKQKYKKQYSGVGLNELSLIEEHFKININIFHFVNEEDTEMFIKSKQIYKEELNLNLFNYHFSLITKIDKYIKNFICECGKIYKTKREFGRHQKKCKNKGVETIYKFKGGRYTPQKNVFQNIEKIIYVEKKLRHNPYFICYDFEAMLSKIEDKENEEDKEDKEKKPKTKWTHKHIPISVSICSNIEGYKEAICIVNDKNNLSEFINKFVLKLIEMSNKASSLLYPQYENIFKKLQEHNLKLKKQETKNKYKYRYIDKLHSFIQEIPIIGFNSGKYDINLIKNYLFDSLLINDQQINFSVKKNNSYMCLSSKNLKFIDILNYLAPGYSYESFLKAYDTQQRKAVFCYEYLDDINKLNDKKLPEYKLWYSSLRNSNITEDEYKEVQQIFKDNKMKNLKDYLIYYNNLDVVPFVEAIEKMKKFYYEKDLDMFKDAISIPGLANKYMFNSSEDAKFDLIDNLEDFQIFKRNNVGGPSIIFNRFQEKNKTKIKNNKICKKIIGFDANALYLGCIGNVMPVGVIQKIDILEDINYYIEQIKNDKLFGFVECDIETPQELKSKFNEFPLIFKNIEIKYNHLTENMKKLQTENFSTKTLISSFYGKKILLYTPLLKFYLRQGLIITKIYQIFKTGCDTPFKNYVQEICNARREGDKDKNKAIIAETMKLLGNSSFGRCILDKTKFNKTFYTNDETKIMKNIYDPYFKDINEINNSCEIIKNHKKIHMDTPIHIGKAIFDLAKLRMLEFVYDFLHEYVDYNDYQFIEMDTDSLYMSISAEKFDDIIKPEKKEQYEREKHKWFVFDDYSKRTPCLFKEEFIGDGMIALNSKCYICYDEKTDKIKLSSKGVSKSNKLTFEDYKKVLFNKKNKKVINRGFRTKDNQIQSYESRKVGLTPFYCKRVLLDDGITTTTFDL